jgi:hypothetical protein
MNEKQHNPTEAIVTAVASLSSLQGVAVQEKEKWYDNVQKWVIRCQLTIDSPNPELILNKTDWYIWLEGIYPQGEIELIPAKKNGITKTFHHQFYNSQGDQDVPWRSGIICAKTEMFWLKKTVYDIEPFEPENRLKWHLNRALEWLCDAAVGNLVKDGEFFELPDYNTSSNLYTIVFCESQETELELLK